ncbi:MAG: rod shape-determining protein MreC [Candidatus Kuenenia sp.]|nr:rod shape-determining protein MreC [Candidatus Kuenenia hertensis]
MWQEQEAKTELENEAFELRNKIIELQDINYKLQEKLSSVSEFQKEQKISKSKIIPADIIGYDTSIFRRSITINVGTKDGVTDNNIVVTDNALVGLIAAAGQRTSLVQLVTDPASRIPGKILQTRDQVIVEGNASPYCQLKYVPRWTKIKTGDSIVSSDIGSFYLSSLPIATVIENETKGGALFQSVKVLPMVNITKIENVLVIKE